MNCTKWKEHLDAYLAVQRAVGKPMIAEEKLLRDFLEHCTRSETASSGQAAMDWARAPILHRTAFCYRSPRAKVHGESRRICSPPRKRRR